MIRVSHPLLEHFTRKSLYGNRICYFVGELHVGSVSGLHHAHFTFIGKGEIRVMEGMEFGSTLLVDAFKWR